MFCTMTSLKDAIEMMNAMCGDGQSARFKNKKKMATFLKLEDKDIGKFYDAMNGKTSPSSKTLMDWMEKLGFKILAPWEKHVENDVKSEIRERADLAMDILHKYGVDDSIRAKVMDAISGRSVRENSQNQRAAGE